MKRISVLDIFLIFLLIFGIAGAFWRVRTVQPIIEDESVSVTLMQRDMYKETAQKLRVGDLLFDSAGNAWGRMESITVKPARIEMEQNGIFYFGEWESGEKSDIWITVTMTGSRRADCFLQSGRTPVSVGGEYRLHTACVTLALEVTEIAFHDRDSSE